MDLYEERNLVARAQQGDQEALELLWSALTPKLFGYLMNTLRHKSLAEDMLQSTWLKALQNLSKFRDRGKGIQGWLFQIARNECHTHWRKSGREVPLEPEIHDTGINEHKTTEDAILIEQILGLLSEDDREVLRLRYIAGLSLKSIAEALNITHIAARVRVHRARTRAQKLLVSQS